MKRKTTKRPTREQKLKDQIEELEQWLSATKRERDTALSKRDEYKSAYEEILKRIEGRPIEPLMTVTDERDWLRATLRLVIVPKGREDALAHEIEEERSRRPY